MARPLRIQYAGAVYHVTCRGNKQIEETGLANMQLNPWKRGNIPIILSALPLYPTFSISHSLMRRFMRRFRSYAISLLLIFWNHRPNRHCNFKKQGMKKLIGRVQAGKLKALPGEIAVIAVADARQIGKPCSDCCKDLIFEQKGETSD